MKKTALALAVLLAAAAGPTTALADDAPAASPLSFNVGAVSDYRYRGISQSKLKPALQGGIDFASGPVYVGTWASSIGWVKDAMVAYNHTQRAQAAQDGTVRALVDEKGAPVEWDVYGGTKGDIIPGTLTYDVGVLAYVYLGEKFHQIGLSNPDTGEVYGALTYGIFTAKVSVSATPLFGIPRSEGSQYYDLSANFDLGSGFTLTPDVGYQNVAGSFARDNGLATYSYGAYAATLAKDFGQGLSASLQVIATDAEKSNYVTSGGRFTGRTSVVAGIKYTF